MASTLTLPQAKDELEKLITCGSVQYVIDGYIGVVKNNYVLFPNDNHKYRYNRDKLISNKLFLKISDHLYTMSSNVKNKNMYIHSLTDDFKEINEGKSKAVEIDSKKINFKQAVRLVKQNIDDKKISNSTWR